MVKKIIKWLFYTFLTLVLGVTASLYLFKDRIIEQVLVEVNNYLAVPVNVSKVDIDFLHGLPNISIAFYDVELPANEDPAIEVAKLYALLNPIEILRGHYTIKRLHLVDADLHLRLNKDHELNVARLFKSADIEKNEDADSSSTDFNLAAILLRDVRIVYTNDLSGAVSHLDIKELNGNFRLEEGVYRSKVTAKINLKEHRSPAWQIAEVGEFTYDFDINYQAKDKLLSLNKSTFTFRGAGADLSGSIQLQDEPEADLLISADDISFKLLADLLPVKAASFIKQYQSKGTIALEARMQGRFTKTTMPKLTARLDLNKVDLTQKKFNANVRDLNMTCQLQIGDLAKLSSAELSIDQGQGLLQDKPFNLSFKLKNFAEPSYSGNIKATVTSDWLLSALQFDQYKSGQGEVEVMLKINNNTRQKSLLGDLELSGAIEFKNVSFALNDSVAIKTINGYARFNPSEVQLANFKLRWLSSDLTINGSILDRNLDNKTPDLTLRSDVKSGKLAIEDIVALVSSSNNLFVADSTTSESDIQLDLDLVASLDSLTFRRFRGAAITGEVLYQENVLEVIDLNAKAMGGALKLDGKLKEVSNKDIVIQANAKTKGVSIDSLFYVFNNFRQDFIRDEHLKGRVYADVDALLYFDKNWRFRRQLLSATAKIGIMAGELNNFEPIMALSPYLDDKDDNLSQLRFSELVNNVRIRQDTVFIPEMSIRTNVRNIALGGYHTLDQHINYQLVVPIINERVDKDEAFGAIKKSSKGSPNLLFRIKGTTSDYRVNYDLLRATGNVLKLLDITKIFRKKEEMPMDSSFLDDEDFDW